MKVVINLFEIVIFLAILAYIAFDNPAVIDGHDIFVWVVGIIGGWLLKDLFK